MLAASMNEQAMPEVDREVDEQEAEEAALEREEKPEPEDLDEILQQEAEEAAAWAAQEAERLRQIHAAAHKLATRPATVVHAVLRSRLGAYTTTQVHRAGEVADLLVATRDNANGPDDRCLLKVARHADDNDLLDTEARVLAELHTKSDVQSKFFRKYIPVLIDSFDAEGRRVNVLDVAADYVSLAEIRAAYPDGIDVLDAVWMLRRMFEVLGWVHMQGYVHGAVLPEHVLVHPDEHWAKLVGWSYAVHSGSAMTAVSALRKDMYPEPILRRTQATPALDVALAVESTCMLISDRAGQLRPGVPALLASFFARCRARLVSDGWAAYREYDEILKQLYGKRRYRKFAMPG